MPILKQLLWRRFILSAAVVCALSVPVTEAQAALATYSFAGDLDNDPMGKYSISGSFTFDKATSGSGGVYHGAVTDFTFNLSHEGVLVYTSTFTPGHNAVTVSKDMPSPFGGILDRWAMVSAATSDQLLPQGIPPVDYAPYSFDIRLNRMGGGLFADTSLQDPPSLGSLGIPDPGSARWRLFVEDADGNPAAFLGSIHSLTAVPLPAGVVLFGIGLISLVGLGAGGVRKLQGSRA
jgi:hypothetical protein